MPNRRAYPAAVSVPEYVLRQIALTIALIPKDGRIDVQFPILSLGDFRANTTRVLIYVDGALMLPIEADLVGNVLNCKFEDISNEVVSQMGRLFGRELNSPDTGAKIDSLLSLMMMMGYDSLRPQTSITVLFCKNFRGRAIKEFDHSGIESYKD